MRATLKLAFGVGFAQASLQVAPAVRPPAPVRPATPVITAIEI